MRRIRYNGRSTVIKSIYCKDTLVGFGTFMNPFKLSVMYLPVGTCAFFLRGESPLLSSFSEVCVTTWCQGTYEGKWGGHRATSLQFPFKPRLVTQLQGVCSINSIQLSAPSGSSPLYRAVLPEVKSFPGTKHL